MNELNVLIGVTNESPYSETAPGSILSTFNAAVLGQLIKVDENFDLSPGLLESWQWDYKTNDYVLKIRPNQYFHSGREITALDLEFSLLRGFFSKNQSFYRTYLSNVKGVEKIKPGTAFRSGMVEGIKIIDPLTVRVKLSHPNPSFLLGLTGPYFSFVPIESLNSDYLTWKSFPIGAGPYRVSEPYKDGLTILKKMSQNKLDTAQTIFLYTSLKKKNYDISTFSSADLDLKNDEIFISELPSSILNFSFSNLNPISNDIEFRKFVKFTISKKELLTGLNNYSVSEELLPKYSWGRKGLKSESNHEGAIKLLTSHKVNLIDNEIHLCVFSGPTLNLEMQQIVNKLKEQFLSVGIKMSYETSLEKFISKESARKYHLFLSGMVSDYIDPLVMFASLTKRGADEYTRPPEDKTLESLYQDASENAQKESRIESLHKLSAYVNEKIYIVPIAEKRARIFYNREKVKSIGIQNQPLTLFLDRITLN